MSSRQKAASTPQDHKAEDLARFMQKVLLGPSHCDCWGWSADRADERYGRFSVDGRPVKAHRWIYELLHGPIPKDMVVRHRCDAPECVNPMHLELGTSAQNTADIIERGRWPNRKGVRHPLVVLSEAQVVRIRALATQGITQKRLAEMFEISRQHVGKIIRRESWGHI